MKIWLNDQWQDPANAGDLFDTAAFQYGFGLFETILVQEGAPADLQAHIRRLMRSCQHFDSTRGYILDDKSLKEKIYFALQQHEEKNGVLKIIAYREKDRWNTLLMARPYPYSSADYERGFALKQSAYLRNPHSLLVSHKTLNYLENYLERQKACDAGYNDMYFLNAQGVVTECTASNIFVLWKGEWITSPVCEGLLPGIMRAKLLDSAGKLGLKVREFPIRKEMLAEADMVLVTNALLGAMPVSQIDNTCIGVDRAFIQKVNKVLGRGMK